METQTDTYSNENHKTTSQPSFGPSSAGADATPPDGHGREPNRGRPCNVTVWLGVTELDTIRNCVRGEGKTLVLLDIDDTLIRSDDKRLAHEGWPAFIEWLRGSALKTCLLTARSIGSDARTREELSRAGLDLGSLPHLGLPAIALDAELGRGHESGIIYAGISDSGDRTTKADILRALVAAGHMSDISHIVVVDDRLDQLRSIADLMREIAIPSDCFEFVRACSDRRRASRERSDQALEHMGATLGERMLAGELTWQMALQLGYPLDYVCDRMRNAETRVAVSWQEIDEMLSGCDPLRDAIVFVETEGCILASRTDGSCGLVEQCAGRVVTARASADAWSTKPGGDGVWLAFSTRSIEMADLFEENMPHGLREVLTDKRQGWSDPSIDYPSQPAHGRYRTASTSRTRTEGGGDSSSGHTGIRGRIVYCAGRPAHQVLMDVLVSRSLLAGRKEFVFVTNGPSGYVADMAEMLRYMGNTVVTIAYLGSLRRRLVESLAVLKVETFRDAVQKGLVTPHQLDELRFPEEERDSRLPSEEQLRLSSMW